MSVHAITPAAVRPRLDCPSWCEYTTMSSHTADYSLELSDGRISRHHARTIWENRGLDVAVQAEEVADPDGGNPSVSAPSIQVYGTECVDLDAELARELGNALLFASTQLDDGVFQL